jgi:hypothetical protein
LIIITSSLVIAAIGALVVLSALDSPQRAQGIGGPQGKAVTVNTPLENDTDGLCSLREAIIATNNENTYDGCDAFGSEQGGTDYITFDIGTGTPQIVVTTLLPPITDKLNINGTGHAARVELRGPEAGAGLSIGQTGSNSVLANLVINNFDVGIYVNADNVTIRGNYIGTNSAGTAAVPNDTGIILDGVAGAQVGGTNGVTIDGPCIGDCNLISGSTVTGIKIGGSGASGVSSGVVIEGNFIGTNAQGTSAIANQDGIYFENGPARIGGATAEASNLISGNTLYGVHVPSFSGAAETIIEGNRIGTNALGDAPLSNGTGVYVDHTNTVNIGVPGSQPNVISGNTSHGVDIHGSDQTKVRNNIIGAGQDGITPVPNGGTGLNLEFATNLVIGGTAAGEGNAIAFSGADGIYVGLGSFHDSIRGNSIFSNAGKGILNSDNGVSGKGNEGLPPPVITLGTHSEVHGESGCLGCQVDIFSDGGDEGRIYEGSTIVDAIPLPFGWTFIGQVQGSNITATSTDSDGNTSEFSLPFTLPATPTPSPTPPPTPSPTATATATATETSTASASHTPTPTPTGSATHKQGDFNCDGAVNETDYDFLLLYVAGLNSGVTPGSCPNLGDPEATSGFPWGDVNCDGHVDLIDVLYIVAFKAGISLPLVAGNCFPIGQAMT